MNLNKSVSGLSVVAVVAIALVLLKFFAFTGSDGKTPFQRVEPALQNASSNVADRVSLSSGVAGVYLVTSHPTESLYAAMEIDLVRVQGNQYTGQITIYKTLNGSGFLKQSSSVTVVASDGNFQISGSGVSFMGTYGSNQLVINSADTVVTLKKISSDDLQKSLANLDAEAKQNLEDRISAEQAQKQAQVARDQAAAPEQIPDGTYDYQKGNKVLEFTVKGNKLELITNTFPAGSDTPTKTYAFADIEYLGNHKFVFHFVDSKNYGQIVSSHGLYLNTQGSKVGAKNDVDGANLQRADQAGVNQMVANAIDATKIQL